MSVWQILVPRLHVSTTVLSIKGFYLVGVLHALFETPCETSQGRSPADTVVDTVGRGGRWTVFL